MMELKILFYIFGLLVSCKAVIYDLNDTDYDRMPELFVLDEYERCMRRPDGVYCLLTLELVPEPNNELYIQIKEYSDHYIRHYNHSLLERGICVPKTCASYTKNTEYSEEGLKNVLAQCLNESIWNEYKFGAKIHALHYCNRSIDRVDTSNLDWIVVAIVALILMINVVGTVYYITKPKQTQENSSNILMSFCIVKNWEELFRKIPDKYENVSTKGINGLRVLGSLQVIFAHVAILASSFGERIQDFEKMNQRTYYNIFMYALPTVQLFFALSGFLQTYILCEFERKRHVSWKDIPKIVLHRFIRLTPSYAVIMLLSMTWIKYLGSGPLWNLYIGGFVNTCGRFFWHHIFYINNYVPEDVQCAVPTWHLAADMQIFILGLFALLFAKKRRMLVLSIMFLLGIAWPTFDVWLKSIEPVTVITPEMLRTTTCRAFQLTHIRVHNNLSSFVAGMMAALFVERYKTSGVTVKNKFLAQLSNLVIPAIIVIYLSNELLYAKSSYPSLWSKLVFAAVYRIALSGILGLAVLAMALKFDSAFCRLFSWSGWEVPSRLSYSVFLIHMPIILQLIGTKTRTAHTSAVNFVTTYLGVTVLSFILGIVLYLLVEAPFNRIVRDTPTVTEKREKNE